MQSCTVAHAVSIDLEQEILLMYINKNLITPMCFILTASI